MRRIGRRPRTRSDLSRRNSLLSAARCARTCPGRDRPCRRQDGPPAATNASSPPAPDTCHPKRTSSRVSASRCCVGGFGAADLGPKRTQSRPTSAEAWGRLIASAETHPFPQSSTGGSRATVPPRAPGHYVPFCEPELPPPSSSSPGLFCSSRAGSASSSMQARAPMTRGPSATSCYWSVSPCGCPTCSW